MGEISISFSEKKSTFSPNGFPQKEWEILHTILKFAGLLRKCRNQAILLPNANTAFHKYFDGIVNCLIIIVHKEDSSDSV